ncbi:MAG: hypothetical protein P4L79_02365 [Legionella sp.]|uniref:hypothetical protein n=1 Tax=Legionella sp. TaxID=459 RepID=UPI002849C037|nr:hypothetical protein [Legionella sp.]
MRTTREQHIFEQVSIALFLANRPDWFPILNKLNGKILQLFRDESMRTALIKELSVVENFILMKAELYVTADRDNNLFKGPLGALIPTKEVSDITIEDALNDIEKMLSNKKANIIDLLPIYSVVGYRIIRLINPPNYAMAGAPFADFLKLIQDEKKIVITKKADDKDIKVTTEFGTLISKPYMVAIAESESAVSLLERLTVPEHRTSWQRFNVNTDSATGLPVIGKFIEHGLPLIAGPSTHIIFLLTAVRALQTLLSFELADDELYELSIAYQAYLTTAGYHTGCEVLYSAANCLKREYDFSSFWNNIPEQIKEHQEFKDLSIYVDKTLKAISATSLNNGQTFFSPAINKTSESSSHLATAAPMY